MRPPALHTQPSVHSALRSTTAALHRHVGASSGLVPVDAELSSTLLEALGVSECPLLLDTLPSNLVAGARGPSSSSADLRRFLVSVARPVASNALLTQMLHAEPLRILGDAADDAEIHRLVHHCLVLDLITAACARDPRLGQAVFAAARGALEATDVRQAWFERAKTVTIEKSLELFDDHRLGRQRIPALFGRIGLPFNILEAVAQDASIGRLPNAWAGVPLMLARPGHAPASVSDDAARAVRVHMPLPAEWQRLYLSWNLAFTTSWADGPYFAASLLAPSVAGAPPEEFVFRRAYALHLQITAQMRARRAGAAPIATLSQGTRDWRDAAVSDAWGELNAAAATAFARKVDAMAGPPAARRLWPKRGEALGELVGDFTGRLNRRRAVSVAAAASAASGLAAAAAVGGNLPPLV
jgi:hypothetical protein